MEPPAGAVVLNSLGVGTWLYRPDVSAAGSAKERVKLAFLIQRIAEKEDIKVAQEEILQRVQALAAMYQMPPEKFLKDLQKRNGLVEIYDQLAHEKVMQFLENNAKVETPPADSQSPPTPPTPPTPPLPATGTPHQFMRLPQSQVVVPSGSVQHRHPLPTIGAE